MEASLSSYMFRECLLSCSVARFSIPFVLKFCDSPVICDSYCCCLVAQLCSTLCDPTDCSPPGSSVCGVPQARILEWVAILFSRGSFQPRDRTRVSCTVRQILYRVATRKALHLWQREVVTLLLFWAALISPWTLVWASSGSWWWTGKPGVLQSMGLQRVGHDWVTELNWPLLSGSPALEGSG